jgi:hypothetical protein
MTKATKQFTINVAPLVLTIQLKAGRCKLNSVDPALERDWFQTLTLEYQSFQIQPAPLHQALRVRPVRPRQGLAQVAFNAVDPYDSA